MRDAMSHFLVFPLSRFMVGSVSKKRGKINEGKVRKKV